MLSIVGLLLVLLGSFHSFLLIKGETTKEYLKKKYKRESKEVNDWCGVTQPYLNYSSQVPAGLSV